MGRDTAVAYRVQLFGVCAIMSKKKNIYIYMIIIKISHTLFNDDDDDDNESDR